jgi:hypothetical protein
LYIYLIIIIIIITILVHKAALDNFNDILFYIGVKSEKFPTRRAEEIRRRGVNTPGYLFVYLFIYSIILFLF